MERRPTSAAVGGHAPAVALLIAATGLFAVPPLAAAAGVPVPLCFEPAQGGAVRARAVGGQRFHVIAPGGLDDSQDARTEAVVPVGATVKLSGLTFQQYVEILALEPGAVRVRNAGWARFVGEFSEVGYINLGCGSRDAPTVASPPFSFSDITLASRIEEVARDFPNSQRVGDYLYIAPQEARDHISGIELSGSGATRRARLSFESPPRAGARRYPLCGEVQKLIESRNGKPTSMREYAEERWRRSDRIWHGYGESMTLLCFRDRGPDWFAEAVVIVPTGR